MTLPFGLTITVPELEAVDVPNDLRRALTQTRLGFNLSAGSDRWVEALDFLRTHGVTRERVRGFFVHDLPQLSPTEIAAYLLETSDDDVQILDPTAKDTDGRCLVALPLDARLDLDRTPQGVAVSDRGVWIAHVHLIEAMRVPIPARTIHVRGRKLETWARLEPSRDTSVINASLSYAAQRKCVVCGSRTRTPIGLWVARDDVARAFGVARDASGMGCGFREHAIVTDPTLAADLRQRWPGSLNLQPIVRPDTDVGRTAMVVRQTLDLFWPPMVG